MQAELLFEGLDALLFFLFLGPLLLNRKTAELIGETRISIFSKAFELGKVAAFMVGRDAIGDGGLTTGTRTINCRVLNFDTRLLFDDPRVYVILAT